MPSGTYRTEGISHHKIYRKSNRIYIAVALPHILYFFLRHIFIPKNYNLAIYKQACAIYFKNKMRYISLCSMRYDINPLTRVPSGTYRTEGISHHKIYRKSNRIYIAVALPHYSSLIFSTILFFVSFLILNQRFKEQKTKTNKPIIIVNQGLNII